MPKPCIPPHYGPKSAPSVELPAFPSCLPSGQVSNLLHWSNRGGGRDSLFFLEWRVSYKWSWGNSRTFPLDMESQPYRWDLRGRNGDPRSFWLTPSGIEPLPSKWGLVEWEFAVFSSWPWTEHLPYRLEHGGVGSEPRYTWPSLPWAEPLRRSRS